MQLCIESIIDARQRCVSFCMSHTKRFRSWRCLYANKNKCIYHWEKRQERQSCVTCKTTAVLSVVCLWTHLLMCDFLQVISTELHAPLPIGFKDEKQDSTHLALVWWEFSNINQTHSQLREEDFQQTDMLLMLPLDLPTTPSTPTVNLR